MRARLLFEETKVDEESEQSLEIADSDEEVEEERIVTRKVAYPQNLYEKGDKIIIHK